MHKEKEQNNGEKREKKTIFNRVIEVERNFF